MNECRFCQIVNKEKKAYIIHESKYYLGFLDQNPIMKGHIQLITKKHRKDMYELDERERETLGKEIYTIINKLSRKFGKSVSVYSSNGPFASQSIKHFHVHLIPRKKYDRLYENGSKIILDRSSEFERLELSNEEMEKLAKEISGRGD